MIGRLLEDLFFVGRLGWFYNKANKEIKSVGFTPRDVSKKEKFKYAWGRAQFK